jgi:hypothetical protein
MDLSNRGEADRWYEQAKEVTDPDLRREALKTFRHFRKLAIKEECQRLRTQKPGYGVRSMLLWIVGLALLAVAVILNLSTSFPWYAVCGVFAFAMCLIIVAAAVSLRLYGYVGEDTMMSMILKSLNLIPTNTKTPSIPSEKENATLDSGQQHRLPSEVPMVSFDNDELYPPAEE